MTNEERQKLIERTVAENLQKAAGQQGELVRKTSEAVASAVPVVTVDVRHVECGEAWERFLSVNASTGFGLVLSELRRLEQKNACRVVLLTPPVSPEKYADEVEAEYRRAASVKQTKGKTE